MGDEETPQREWDERVDRALRANRRGLQLAGKYASAANAAITAAAAAAAAAAAGTSSNAVPPSVSFDGTVLLVTGAGMSAAAAPSMHAAMRARAAPHCPRLTAAARPGWGDPLAPAHAADLADLIAQELLQVKKVQTGELNPGEGEPEEEKDRETGGGSKKRRKQEDEETGGE